MQFSNVIGQQKAKTHICELVQEGKMPHALIVSGAEGVGDLAVATAIAQFVNCLNPTVTDSCGSCDNCKRISDMLHPDVHYLFPIASTKKKVESDEKEKKASTEDFIREFRTMFLADPYLSFDEWEEEVDKATQLFISVDEMREAKRKLLLKSFQAAYKVLIVWNAERINHNGFNAFLKILEEPPEGTLIILCCTDIGQLLPTILSRCQRMFLERLSPAEVAEYLVEFKEMEAGKAQAIARISDGNVKQAKSYIEEAGQAFQNTYVAWLRAVYKGNYEEIQVVLEPVVKSTREQQKAFLLFSLRKLRDSFLYHIQLPEIALVDEGEVAFHQNFGKFLTPEKSETIVSHIENSMHYIRQNVHPQMVFAALSMNMHFVIRAV